MATEQKPEAGKTEVVVSTEQKPAKTTAARALTPWEDMEQFIDRFREAAFPRGWLQPSRWERPLLREAAALEGWMPKVDVVDRDEDILVRAEVPGVEKKDLSVSITEDAVTIEGKTSHEVKEEKAEYYRYEMSRGSFSRTVSLPASVDTEKAAAALKDGVLELTLPKKVTAQSKRLTIS